MAIARDVQAEIFEVRSQLRSLVNEATHACRHIAEILNNGEPLVRAKNTLPTHPTAGKEWAATCPACAEYIRTCNIKTEPGLGG